MLKTTVRRFSVKASLTIKPGSTPHNRDPGAIPKQTNQIVLVLLGPYLLQLFLHCWSLCKMLPEISAGHPVVRMSWDWPRRREVFSPTPQRLMNALGEIVLSVWQALAANSTSTRINTGAMPSQREFQFKSVVAAQFLSQLQLSSSKLLKLPRNAAAQTQIFETSSKSNQKIR